jgi:hypothetical protein
MALSLTWSDNANNTGGVATLTGTGGVATTVYGQLVNTSGVNPQLFAAQGSRTGDGTVTLALGLGYWWLFAQPTAGGTPSNFVYAVVSDNTRSVHERAIQAIKAVLQGMTFAAGPGNAPAAILPAQIFDLLLPNENLVQFPCITLALDAVKESQPGVLTGLDDIVYPVRVNICDLADAAVPTNRPTYLLWRQQIFRKFRHQRLNVPEIILVEVDPQVVVDPKLPAYNHFITGLTLNCKSREIRG